MTTQKLAMQLRETVSTYKSDVRQWLSRMACPGMPLGHFKFSEHAYHPWCLYASNAALAIYNALGLTAQLSEGQRRTWARVFLDHYHEDLGLFLCPQLYGAEFKGDSANHDDRARAEGAAPFKKIAAKLYDLIGEMPPSPDDGTLGFTDIADLETFFEQKRKEQTPYSFGSTIGDFFHKRTLWLRGQGQPVHGDPWIEWGYEYLARIRVPETGLITGHTDDPVSGMNGLFKLSCSTFWNHQRPMPDSRKVVDAVLAIQSEGSGFGEHCEDYNATSLLCRLSRQEGGYRREEILRIISGPVLDRLQARRRPDGGFSFHVEHCLTDVNGYPVCDPLPEGDLFGSGQQLAILTELILVIEG